MILPTRANVVEQATRGTLLYAIFNDLWKAGYQHCEALANELAQAHEDGDVDLLSILTLNSLEAFSGYKAELGKRVYFFVLRQLNIPVTSLLTAVETLTGQKGADVYKATETLSAWCDASPTRPSELMALIDSKQLDGSKYYSLSIAIRSGLKVDLPYFSECAYTIINGGTEAQKIQAIHALSSPPFSLEESWRKGLSVFSSSTQREASYEVRSALMRTLLSWFKTIPPLFVEELHQLVLQFSLPTSPAVAHEIAYALAFNFKDFPCSVTESLLSILRVINPESNTLNLIDYGLAHLLGAGKVTLVRDFIAELILRPDTEIHFENFDSVISKLFEGPPDQLEAWVIYWLRAAPYQLCQELSDGLFHGKDEYSFRSDFMQLDLSELEYGYVARKAIATFFVKPAIAASLLVSLGRCATVEQSNLLSDLLFEPLLINYTSVDKTLRPIADDAHDKAAPMVQKALRELESYCDSLREIGFIAELEPSERERQLEWQRHSDSMNDAMRESRKNSPLSGIFTERILLHGNGMVSWVKDHFNEDSDVSSGQGRRVEQALASFSHQYEIPREEVLDPIGIQKMLMSFKLEGRPE